MSNLTFWTLWTFWLLLVIAFVRWAFEQVRKVDRQIEADEIERDFAYEEWCAEVAERERKGPVFDLPKGSEKGFEKRARKAESLGFMDDDPTRAA